MIDGVYSSYIDTVEPTTVFKQCEAKLWLDSATTDSSDSRFSFMAISKFAEFLQNTIIFSVTYSELVASFVCQATGI